MALDPDKLLALPPLVTRQTLTKRDTILYALGVGVHELDFVFEERLKALPTIPAVLGYPGFFWREPEYGVDWRRVLHGEQSVEIHAPLPVEGELEAETRIEALYDKGPDKGAVALSSRRISMNGKALATVRISTFLRGDGGFGGSSAGQPVPHPVPADRQPDQSVVLKTAANQAMIYRLSGDYNPLHVDPEVAKAGGFPQPILHGLCTYGVAGWALLQALCGADPSRLKTLNVRFSSPVFPGETIVTDIWHEGPGRAAFRASVAERSVMVLNNGYVEFE